jgi:hypothetical protein
MKVIAVIQEPAEIERILRHPGCEAEQKLKAPTRLVKQGRPPPQVFAKQNTSSTPYKALSRLDPDSLN